MRTKLATKCKKLIQKRTASALPLVQRQRVQIARAKLAPARVVPRVDSSLFVINSARAGKPLWEHVGRQIVCYLHEGQQEGWFATESIVAIIAGTQSGKTSYGPLWFLNEIIKCGPGDYIVAAPTYKLMALKCLPEFKRLFIRALHLGKYHAADSKFVFNPDACEAFFGDRNAECVVFFGHAANPDSLESATAKAAWLDECGQGRFKLGSFEALKRRLAINLGRMLLTTTPYNLGWLKTQIYDKWKAGDSSIRVIRFDSTLNPVFPQSVFDREREAMPTWKFNLFYRGIFSVPAGLIYDCVFDDDGNALYTCKRFEIPDEWPRWSGIDFGPINTAAVFAAQEIVNGQRTDRVFIYRTYWPRKTIESKEHVAAIKAGEQKLRAVGGAKTTEQGWRDAFTSAGLRVEEPPVNDVEVGIDCVYGAFARKQLIVFDDLVDLISDIGSYTREVSDEGEATEKIAEKAKFHLCDAMRYLALKLWPPKVKKQIKFYGTR